MQLSFWDLYSLFDKEYNSVIKEAAEKTGLTMNELGVLLFLSNNPSAKTASDIIRIKRATKSHALRSPPGPNLLLRLEDKSRGTS